MNDVLANLRIRTVAIAAALMLVTMALVAEGTALLTRGRISQAIEDWDHFTTVAEDKQLALSNMRDGLGYGGQIHRFKNFVLRGDPHLLVDRYASMVRTELAINRYAATGVSGEERMALNVIQGMLSDYNQRAVTAEQLNAEGKTPRQIDAVVKYNDEGAFAALKRLDQSAVAGTDLGGLKVNDSVAEAMRTVNMGGQVITVLAVMLIGGFIWFVIFRLVGPLGQLGLAMQRLSAGALDTVIPESGHRNELGAMAATVEVFRENMIRRQRAEQEIARRVDDLKRSNRDLEQFASVASHDLQEPLRKVRAFGDRLKQRLGEGMDDTANDYLDRMQSAAARMSVLVNDLLVYSRVSSRGQPFKPVDLDKVLEGVTGDLEIRLEETGAKLAADPLPVIDADPLQMRQLFQNLIANAVKFNRPGNTPIVAIKAREFTDAGEAWCQIEVADNGIGFDPKYAERIFGIFQRLHGRSEYEGTGVGLAVCRKIAERHGGTILAVGRPGEGASFIVTLPVRQEPDEVGLADEPEESDKES